MAEVRSKVHLENEKWIKKITGGLSVLKKIQEGNFHNTPETEESNSIAGYLSPPQKCNCSSAEEEEHT